jgi:hypothetical protein
MRGSISLASLVARDLLRRMRPSHEGPIVPLRRTNNSKMAPFGILVGAPTVSLRTGFWIRNGH